MTSEPGEPDRLAGGGEPALPAQPAGHRQRGEGPDPVQPRGQDLGAGQVPGLVQQLVPHRVQPGLQGAGHLQGGGDLQLPGRRQVSGRDVPQRGQARPGAQRGLAQGRGALVEQDRVEPLHPGGVFGPQIVIQLQQGPALQDVAGRDPAATPGRCHDPPQPEPASRCPGKSTQGRPGSAPSPARKPPGSRSKADTAPEAEQDDLHDPTSASNPALGCPESICAHFGDDRPSCS